MEDIHLICHDCARPFVFSASEQVFFQQKGLINQPKRCVNCRLVNRNWRQAASGECSAKITQVSCDRCGATTKVPFEVKGHRPVYCRACLFAARQKMAEI